MVDAAPGAQTVAPSRGMVRLTHLIYALHGFSALMGVLSSAFIVTAFLFGWPSIIAVILNYAQRGEARGTFLESHFDWQLRTFWWAVPWGLLGWLLTITIVGAVVGVPLLILLGLWVIYRIIRGWLRLGDGRPMPV